MSIEAPGAKTSSEFFQGIAEKYPNVSDTYSRIANKEAKKERRLIKKLMTPDGVESLVATGRRPLFLTENSISAESVLVGIPPEGTQFGDRYWVTNDIAGAYFRSPEGEFRGNATLVRVTEEQAKDLNNRINQKIEELRSLL